MLRLRLWGKGCYQVSVTNVGLRRVMEFAAAVSSVSDWQGIGRGVLLPMLDAAGADLGALILTPPDQPARLLFAVGLSTECGESEIADLIQTDTSGLLRRLCAPGRHLHDLSLPLNDGGSTIGFAALGRTNSAGFDEQTVAILELMAIPAAGAIQRGLSAERLHLLKGELERLKSEFLSTVSHELRTPLTSIQGFVDLVLDGDAGPISAEQKEYLEIVRSSSLRLGQLIGDLLDVQRLQQGRLELRSEPVDLRAVLHRATEPFLAEAGARGIALRVVLPPETDLWVTGDSDRLTQVFHNLLSNAMKHTSQGGIHVEALSRTGGGVAVTVTDTGPGIDPVHVRHLFETFYRVDNRHTRDAGGAGLGLSISRAIIQRHGGEIGVKSSPGGGSTFHVVLPGPRPSAGHRGVRTDA